MKSLSIFNPVSKFNFENDEYIFTSVSGHIKNK